MEDITLYKTGLHTKPFYKSQTRLHEWFTHTKKKSIKRKKSIDSLYHVQRMFVGRNCSDKMEIRTKLSNSVTYTSSIRSPFLIPAFSAAPLSKTADTC